MSFQPNGVRTFRVNTRLRMLMPALLACGVALGVVYLATPADIRWVIGILALVLLIGLGLGVWLTTRARLEISPEQITYFGAGYLVRSTWENVEGYSKRVMGASEIECLILREPGMELNGWMRAGYGLMPFANIVALLTGRSIHLNTLRQYEDAIPVAMFAQEWRDGEIGSLVKRYAPQAYNTPLK